MKTCTHTHLCVFASAFNYSCDQGPTTASFQGESHMWLAPMSLSPACMKIKDTVSQSGEHPQLCYTYEASECLCVHCQALTRTITQVQANMQHSDLDN